MKDASLFKNLQGKGRLELIFVLHGFRVASLWSSGLSF
jgi:hypothetical protein